MKKNTAQAVPAAREIDKRAGLPEALLPYALILMLGYAFYNIALRFVPIDFDDLVLLSSVKNVNNPLTFFMGDWGFGNYGYRPLHSLSLWLGYQLVGVSSGPNQLLNILLHCAVIMLLFALLEKLLSRKHWALALALASLGLISLYTASAPTWVSDRPTLLVSLLLMVLLNYLARLKVDETPKAWVLGILSLLALLSKESGLILPLVSLYVLAFESRGKSGKLPAILLLMLLLAAYSIFRFVLFGQHAATYSEAGYLLGRTYYASLDELQGFERLAGYFENAFKNMLAVFLPVFDGQGQLALIGTRLNSLAVLGCTLLLFILSLGRKLTRFQKIALIIILLNSMLHFQLFRYRTLYIPQLAFLIFIASSDALKGENPARRLLVFSLAALFVLWNTHMLGENLNFELVERVQRLAQTTFEQDILATSNRIDAGIVREIIAKYRH